MTAIPSRYAVLPVGLSGYGIHDGSRWVRTWTGPKAREDADRALRLFTPTRDQEPRPARTPRGTR